MAQSQQLSIFLNDSQSKEFFPSHPKGIQVVTRPGTKFIERTKNIFVFSAASQLQQVRQFIKDANQCHHLRGLFVRMDVDPSWLPQVVSEAKIRTLKNMLVFTNDEIDVPQRFVQIWQTNAPEKLIGKAGVDPNGETLRVVNGTLEHFEFQFNAVTALKRIPMGERSHFEIAEEGSYIHWPTPDIHMDLNGLRTATDPKLRKQAIANKLRHNRKFGRAVAILRKEFKLRQADFEGLTARQISRIETGEQQATFKALETLAAAHGMEMNDYLERVSGVMGEIE